MRHVRGWLSSQHRHTPAGLTRAAGRRYTPFDPTAKRGGLPSAPRPSKVSTRSKKPASRRGGNPAMAENPASRMIAVTDIEWKRHDALPGLRQKELWTDAATQRRAGLARFEPGATLPMHRHVGDEILFVI